VRKDKTAMAETIENNLRKVITDEAPVNPHYYAEMSELLDALIEQRRAKALEYQAYLEQVIALTKMVKQPGASGRYATGLDTQAKRALYDNLGQNEALALALDAAIREHKKDGWLGHPIKERALRNVVKHYLPEGAELDRVFDLVKEQPEYL
jgi:type I restriction enzyme R subunit